MIKLTKRKKSCVEKRWIVLGVVDKLLEGEIKKNVRSICKEMLAI
jgi:hypothetical protein